MPKKKSPIGQLRERVAIYTQSNAESGDSAAAITYTLVNRVSCKAVNVAGKVLVNSRGQTFAAAWRFEIRRYKGLQSTHRIDYFDKFQGETYRLNIVAQQNVDEVGERQYIFCNIESENGEFDNPAPSLSLPVI